MVSVFHTMHGLETYERKESCGHCNGRVKSRDGSWNLNSRGLDSECAVLHAVVTVTDEARATVEQRSQIQNNLGPSIPRTSHSELLDSSTVDPNNHIHTSVTTGDTSQLLSTGNQRYYQS